MYFFKLNVRSFLFYDADLYHVKIDLQTMKLNSFR